LACRIRCAGTSRRGVKPRRRDVQVPRPGAGPQGHRIVGLYLTPPGEHPCSISDQRHARQTGNTHAARDLFHRALVIARERGEDTGPGAGAARLGTRVQRTGPAREGARVPHPRGRHRGGCRSRVECEVLLALGCGERRGRPVRRGGADPGTQRRHIPEAGCGPVAAAGRGAARPAAYGEAPAAPARAWSIIRLPGWPKPYT
jgi:hypothetical protein